MAKKSTTEKPSKPSKNATDEPKTITVTYDLFDLPTAQHKAGLAGLLLQIDSMRNRKKLAPAYRWDADSPASRVHVEFTEENAGSLFDDLYDAAWIEGPPREKPFFRGKGDAKKEVPAVRKVQITKVDKKGNEKTVDGHIYLELTPALSTLRHFLPERGEWVRLWRDLIWNVIRDSKKKAPFIQRAAAKAPPEGATLTDDAGAEEDGAEEDEKGKGDGSTWADVIKYETSRKKNEFAVGKLSSALLLGAQSVNAECIAFAGRLDQNLLLHFWPLTVMVYVPRFIDPDGNSHIGRRNKDDKGQHFCVVVPEVANLKYFLSDYPKVLSALSTEQALHRPKESLIDLAAEGGLSFVEHLARLGPQKAMAGEVKDCVSGVDYLHVCKDGNIVRFITTGRVATDRYLAERYREIVGAAGEKPRYGNPLFRRGLMQALLDGKPWFQPFGKLFADWDSRFFVPSDDPPKLSWFWADARKRLREVYMSMEPNDPAPDEDDLLASTVNRLIRRYLDARLQKDAGYDFEKYRQDRKTPPEAADARRKLAERLFLEFRSRRDQAFVDHFAGTFFAVGQYLGGKPVPRLFEKVAAALMTRTEDVKTLTLMALSANSWVPAKKKETK